jgi:mRNA interferase MazF
MKSGDVVIVALSGDFGKPRPAMVLIADAMATLAPRIAVVPMTTTLVDASSLRVTVLPSSTSGLREPSQLMIDRLTTVPREKIGAIIGTVEGNTLYEATQRIVAFLGA